MKLVDGFVIKTIGGKCVAVATGEAALRFKGMIVLNETAKFIFNCLLDGMSTTTEIATALTENFDISKEKALDDVCSFIAKITELNIIVE